MGALSDVLRTINLSGVVFLRADLGGEYGMTMPPPTVSHPLIRPQTGEHRLAMFHIVQEGSGYFEVEGYDPQQLNEGDLVIVLDDLHHSVVDSPGRPTIPSSSVTPEYSDVPAPPEVHLGEGERTLRLVCGMLEFVERGFNPVFAALPAYLHITKDDGPSSAWLQANLAHIIREAESGRPGSETLLSRLTELLFVETLRCYLEKTSATESGWFAALKDPNVGQALQFIHESPAHSWTVATLAKRVGVSRSAFAARFSELLDITPIAYLTRWRIRLATNLLENQKNSIAEIAGRVGYVSESAFHRAFKREMGVPPAEWRSTVATTANPDA